MAEEGVVRWFNPEKGYGFIVRAAGADVFVHQSAIVGEDKTLREGERVSFDAVEDFKGLHAENVVKITAAAGLPVPPG